MKNLTILCFLIVSICAYEIYSHKNEIEDLRTIPTKMFAGEIHYSRIPV